jgi:mercuric ion transport protein
MLQDKKLAPAAPPPAIGGDTAQAALTTGGLLAAFGVASCCALPLALPLLGISAASLIGIGFVAGQYQRELFYGSVICLAAAAFVMARRRKAQACSPAAARTRAVLDWSCRIALVLALGLLALTFWIAPPI